MNSSEILMAQFRTFVAMARMMKNNNCPAWELYVYKAEAVLKQIQEDKTREIDMNDYLIAA